MAAESLKEATKRCCEASEKINQVWKGQPDEEYRKAVDDWQEANRIWIDAVNPPHTQEE